MAGIVWLTRGHGFGHAARDLRILRSLRELCPGAEILLASSGTGVKYYSSRGVPCHDLGIEDRYDRGEDAVRRVWQFLRTIRDPDLVIADEVVWAPPFCRRFFDCPRVLLTDWLYADQGLPQHDPFLDAASEIFVLDFPEAHPGPYAVTAPVTFTGPVVEEFPDDRGSARKRLGLSPDQRVAVVTVGGRPGRPFTRRLAREVAAAWSMNASASDVMFVLGGTTEELPGAPDAVRQVTYTESPEVYYRAADVVVTDARGTTSFEIAANGIPLVPMLSPENLDLFRRRTRVLESAGLAVSASIGDSPDEIWSTLAAAQELPRHDTLPPAALTWVTSLDVARQLVAGGAGSRPT
jgi:hypothetical protein